MDELIKKIVPAAIDAVQWADWEKWAEKSLEEFAAEVIKLADAERGKEAVAWCSDGFATTEPSKAIQWKQNGYEVHPLFLSPAIPEDMVLVKRAVLRDRGFARVECGLCIPTVTVQFRPDDWDSRDKFAACMIADAQGERK